MINNVYDLRRLAPAQLPALAADLRTDIIDVVSARGGHLASSLGVVELTIALHYVFDTPVDTLIWDVGHQAYAHKILTGRREAFRTLRSHKGLSGFPKISESEFDRYNAGHSSTSISLALGEAAARDLDGKHQRVVAIIGDGALSGGMAFEALNQMGEMKKDVIIILNDNEHSISRNVGALSNYLNRIISDPLYNQVRKTSHNLLSGLPGPLGKHVGRIFDRTEANLKHLFVPGQLFEDLGLRYFGPVDGHDLNSMIELLQRVRSINNGPKIVHVITSKGKGYVPAEKNPSVFHGIGPFERESGLVRKSPLTSYSEIVGQTLTGIACQDRDIVTITAAMASGTGLDIFAGRHPERFYDVGIAEQHAVTFAAAMARNGKKPFVSVYSTFLQRAYDQLIHDVAIMNLPVRVLIDRAGIVGEDGETHHGLFDISFMKNIPNFKVLSPCSGNELKDALHFAASYNDGPLAIRFPRGGCQADDIDFTNAGAFDADGGVIVREGRDLALLALGDMVPVAQQIATMLETEGISVAVMNLLSVRPLPIERINTLLESVPCFATLENGFANGGIGSEIVRLIPRRFRAGFLNSYGFDDIFVTHGTQNQLFAEYGLDAQSIAVDVRRHYDQYRNNA